MYRLHKNEAINFSIVVGQDTALYHKENDQFSEAFVSKGTFGHHFKVRFNLSISIGQNESQKMTPLENKL